MRVARVRAPRALAVRVCALRAPTIAKSVLPAHSWLYRGRIVAVSRRHRGCMLAVSWLYSEAQFEFELRSPTSMYARVTSSRVYTLRQDDILLKLRHASHMMKLGPSFHILQL